MCLALNISPFHFLRVRAFITPSFLVFWSYWIKRDWFKKAKVLVSFSLKEKRYPLLLWKGTVGTIMHQQILLLSGELLCFSILCLQRFFLIHFSLLFVANILLAQLISPSLDYDRVISWRRFFQLCLYIYNDGAFLQFLLYQMLLSFNWWKLVLQLLYNFDHISSANLPYKPFHVC